MKKWSVLSIAFLFCVLSVGTALADEVKINALDRHAVWTVPDEGEPWHGYSPEMWGMEGETRNVSTGETASLQMDGEKGRFDFIRETKSYDYDKDHGRTS